MDAITHILASSNDRIYFNAEEPAKEKARLYEMPASQPEYGAWAEKVMFIVRVMAVGGAPTAWSLGVKFQYEIPHVNNEQYFFPAWSDLDSVAVQSDIFEGKPWGEEHRTAEPKEPQEGGYGLVATNASALPVIVKRTITNFGRDVRIKLDPFAEGGTNPYLNAVILAVPMS